MWTLHGTCMICGSTTDGYIADNTEVQESLYCYSCEEPVETDEIDLILRIDESV